MTLIHSLSNLEEQLHYHLSLLRLPEPNWPPARTHQGHAVYDVVIVGAGMSGACAAAALKLQGIHNIALFDAAPAHQEGPWATFARMDTLRSPKELTGPALGIPMLTFQAWYTAQHGTQAWQALDRIPRLVWHDYLQWYTKVLQLPVNNQQQLLNIDGVRDERLATPLARLHFQDDRTQEKYTRYARHVVLALGMSGFGGPNIPAWAQSLPKECWYHSSEVIDPQRFEDKRLAVVGGGDSALDAAATALEQGAQHVDLCIRGKGYSHINYSKALSSSGYRAGYTHLSTAQKSALLGFLAQQPTPPSRGTVARIIAAEQQRPGTLTLHFEHEIQQAHVQQDELLLTGHGPDLTADLLVLATGYRTDPRMRPELHALLPHIQFYEAHALAPDVPGESGVIPTLNPDFSFQTRPDADYPLAAQIHCFMHAAILSVGRICGDIPGISQGANQIAQGIAAKLYQAEFDHALTTVKNYDELEVSDEALQPLLNLARPAIVEEKLSKH